MYLALIFVLLKLETDQTCSSLNVRHRPPTFTIPLRETRGLALRETIKIGVAQGEKAGRKLDKGGCKKGQLNLRN